MVWLDLFTTNTIIFLNNWSDYWYYLFKYKEKIQKYSYPIRPFFMCFCINSHVLGELNNLLVFESVDVVALRNPGIFMHNQQRFIVLNKLT